MKRSTFGSLGLEVTAIGLGIMPLAIAGRPDRDAASALIRHALEGGINWFDTADSYCLDDDDFGYGERLLASALKAAGAPKVLSVTKGGYARPGGEWQLAGAPERLKACCEASLRALGTDSIFLYLLHGPDPAVPLAESMGALAELQRAGKIRHLGICNVDVGHLHEAQREAEVRVVQNRYNLFDQWSRDNGVLDYCRARKIPFVAHSPLGGHKGHVRAAQSSSVQAVAQRRGLSPEQVCLAWLLSQDGVFPIPGSSRRASLESNLAVKSDSISQQDVTELEAAHPPAKLLRPTLLRARNNLRWLGRTLSARLR